jgi:hypothetical protein
MERAAGPIIGVCVMLVLGLGLYSWSLHSSLSSAEARLALVTKNADTSTTNAETFKTQVTAQTAALDSCKSELQEANNRADAAQQSAQSKSGGGKSR